MKQEASYERSSRARGLNSDAGQRLDSPASLWWTIALQALPWLLCIGTFILICRSGLALQLGLWLRYDHLMLPFVIGGSAWVVWSFAGTVRFSAFMALLIFLSGVVLMGTWQAGLSDGGLLAGVFPFSDAQGYFVDAVRLIHHETMTTFSSRRPLFAVFLAFVLYLTNLDLRLTLIVLTVLATSAIGLASYEAYRTLGKCSGGLMLVCLFMFYRRYVGSTLTEQLGLTLGCIAFVLLCRAAVEYRPIYVLAGLFVLSLALTARAGTFLILPALIIWAVWIFRHRAKYAFPLWMGCLIAVGLPFLITLAILFMMGSPQAAFSNFSYVLYGLVFRGNWLTVLQHHPDLATLAPVEQANRIYTLAWEQILAHPSALFSGCVRAWITFFGVGGGSEGWFAHILTLSPEWSYVKVKLQLDGIGAAIGEAGWRRVLEVYMMMLETLCLNVFLLAGIVVAWRNRRHPLILLFALSWISIVLSVPFVPPWDSDRMRAYAATLPFVIAMPMLGFWYNAPASLATDVIERRAEPTGVVGLLALGLLIILPIVVFLLLVPRNNGMLPTQSSISCAAGSEQRFLRLIPGAAVRVLGDLDNRGIDLGVIGVSLQEIGTRNLEYELAGIKFMWRDLAQRSPGAILLSTYDLERGTTVNSLIDSARLPPNPVLLVVCGQHVRYGMVDWFRIEAATAYSHR